MHWPKGRPDKIVKVELRQQYNKNHHFS